MLDVMDPAQPAAPPGPPSVQALFPLLYNELRRLARSRLAAGGRHTLLDTASLVHEAYLRMQRDGGVALNDREHFLAYAATTMRSVVIDFVRRRNAERPEGLFWFEVSEALHHEAARYYVPPTEAEGFHIVRHDAASLGNGW